MKQKVSCLNRKTGHVQSQVDKGLSDLKQFKLVTFFMEETQIVKREMTHVQPPSHTVLPRKLIFGKNAQASETSEIEKGMA